MQEPEPIDLMFLIRRSIELEQERRAVTTAAQHNPTTGGRRVAKDNRIITPEAVLSYPNLFTPRAVEEGQEPKYGASLVFLAGTDLTDLKRVIANVAREKWADKAGEVLRKARHKPLRSGDDAEDKGYPEGSTFLTARSKRKPGIVSVIPNKEGKPSVITDEDEVYPGMIVRASLEVFAYDKAGNKGIGFSLGNVQKIRDGDRLDSYVAPEDEFEADPNAVADLGALEDDADEVEEQPKPRRGRKAAKATVPADAGDDSEDDLDALLNG